MANGSRHTSPKRPMGILRRAAAGMLAALCAIALIVAPISGSIATLPVSHAPGPRLAFASQDTAASTSTFVGTDTVWDDVAPRELYTYIQTIYDDEAGLPGGIANDIVQTKDGVLWIGTYGGLFRYSGKTFEKIELEGVGSVNCLCVDSADRLWIGTNDNGLFVYDNGAIIATFDEEQGLPANSVRCIAQGLSGRYYVGTTGALAVLDFLDNIITPEHMVPEVPYAISLAVTGQGRAAAVNDDGDLFILQNAVLRDTITCPVPGETFNCVAFGTDSRLYAGTDTKIVVYDIDYGVVTQAEVIDCPGLHTITSLTFSPRKRLLICAFNGVGYLDQEGNFHNLETGSFASSIGHALVDYQGNVWFTSSRQGLLKLSVSPFAGIYFQAGLGQKVVNAITKWQGKFYTGTDSGIDVFGEDQQTEPLPAWAKELVGTRIRSLTVDSANNLWVSTSGQGLWRIAPDGTKQVYDSKNGTTGQMARMVLELSDGTIVLAGDNGLSFIKDGKVQSIIGRRQGLEIPKILSLYEMPDGTLLAGTDGNGIALIRDGAVADYIEGKDGLTSQAIIRMTADPKGEGVFVVTSNGLCFMDNDYEVTALGNFPNNSNFDVIDVFDNDLFVTSAEGIYVVDRDALLAGGDDLDFELLDRKAGLRTGLTPNAFNYLDENNDLYLPGDTGVTVINIGDYDDEPTAYHLNLRGVQVDDESYPVTQDSPVTVPRDSQRIQLLPEIIDYTANDPYVSLYLEGFDSEPRITRLSNMADAVYTNLPPGEYTYRIAVLDSNKNPIVEGAYPITKKSEIYDAPWFYLVIGLIIIVVVAQIIWIVSQRRMKHKIEEQQRELEVARKQIEMANQAVLTIARTVDAKDSNTSEHSFRVSEYSVMLGKRMGLNDDQIDALRRTALLHDIGKIGIPDSILNKPGKLTEEEYEVMKTHPVLGGKILSKFTSVDYIIEGAQYHHERWDGNGYPEGLAGEDIPLFARIIGMADAFDAMTANRVYRKALEMEDVLAELKRCRGTQFDPEILDVMLDLIDDGTIDVEALVEESKANPEDRVQA